MVVLHKFAFDAGHAGFGITPGKRTPDGMYEWEFNNAVLNYVKNALDQYQGVSTLILSDPTGKRDVPLKERVAKANAFNADFTLSIHANAYGTGGWNDKGEGIETWIFEKASQKSLEVASAIQNQLIQFTGRLNRGVKRGNLYMTKYPKGPAALVECGFMTNREEAALLKTDAYRKKCAEAIIEAYVSVYKLVPKSKPAPEPAAAPKKEESVQILTGGLSPAMVEEVSTYFKEKGWWAQVQFTADGKNPRALSGGLDPKMRAEYEKWLKERSWFYSVFAKK